MSSATRFVAVLTLGLLLPATLSAQRIANERAGFAPRALFALPTHVDTAVDSITPHRSRAKDALAGGIIGAIAGGLAGGIYAQQSTRNCSGDMCGLAGLAIIPAAAIGLVGGVVIGALWPTH